MIWFLTMTIDWIGSKPANHCAGRFFNLTKTAFTPMAIVFHQTGLNASKINLIMNTEPGKRTDVTSPCIGSGANAQRPFSYHYGIFNGGIVHQYVRDEDRAFHAGRVSSPRWPFLLNFECREAGELNNGHGRCVSPDFYTIGIAIETPAPECLAMASQLLVLLSSRWTFPINEERVVGHNLIFGKTSCPGVFRGHLSSIVASALEQSTKAG